MADLKETQYGFIWGPVTIERVTSVERKNGFYVLLDLKTKREKLEITITPSGLFRIGKVVKIK